MFLVRDYALTGASMRNRFVTIFSSLLFLSILNVSFAAKARSADSDTDARKAIETVLHMQQEAWNRSDLEARILELFGADFLLRRKGA